ncbi:MAG: FkbM family methyltransferase [bacterium]|nr:FkbM family methyltransferase [bacterium]
MLQSIKQDNVEIKMEVTNNVEKYRIETLFSKEPETISWIRELIKPSDVLYDVGSNVGVFSLFAGIFHNRQVKVLSFEPAHHNFDRLCDNIIANELSGTVVPYCIGIGKESKFGQLNISDATSGSAGHRIDSTTYQSGIGSSSHKVGEEFLPVLQQGIFTASIDDLVGEYGLPAPSHLKIDIDGGEEDILAGAKKSLTGSVRSVMIELDDKGGSLEEAVSGLMTKLGFDKNHPINFQDNHSKKRRAQEGHAHIKNIIFVK